MAANPTIRESVDAFRELLKIRQFHRHVEPIQHVLSFRRHLLVNGSQTGIPIRPDASSQTTYSVCAKPRLKAVQTKANEKRLLVRLMEENVSWRPVDIA